MCLHLLIVLSSNFFFIIITTVEGGRWDSNLRPPYWRSDRFAIWATRL